MLRELFLLGAGFAGFGCLSLDPDPEGSAPETLTAAQWQAWDADSDELLEKGCAEGRPTLHVAKGQKVRLELMYETVKRKAGLTRDACDTSDDLSREPQSDVLAAHCYLDFAEGTSAELVSFATVPAGAKVEGNFAHAAGYVYVLNALGSGTIEHRYASDCARVDAGARIAELVVKN